MKRRDFLAAAGGGLVAAVLVACGKKSLGTPTTVVRDDSKGLLLTWIDAGGEYHVEESTRAVPFEGRDYVRVVDGTHDDGANIVIVDLRNTKPDGSYPVHYVTRAEFEGVAANRKKLRASPSSSANDSAKPTAAAGGSGGVIIYGASWCKPCHMAAAHFKRKGVPFVEKDIEEDPAAAREMQKKLIAAGKRGGSIPVIDVRGKILLGFDSEAVDAALEATK